MNCPFAEECSTAICPAPRFLCFLCSFSILLPAPVFHPSLGLTTPPGFPIKPCGITIPCRASAAGTLRVDNWMNTNGCIIGVKLVSLLREEDVSRINRQYHISQLLTRY